MPTMIDAGRDDYYRHGNPNCLDLDKSPYLKPANVAVAPVQDIFLAECNGQAATIVGDGLPVFGTDGDDVIVAGFSNEVNGGPGNDLICGNNNNNILVGGLGDDIIFGMGGDDQLFGGNGNDTLYGGPGNDRLLGQKMNDILDGGPGTDRCNGGSGNNTRTNCE
jgi:Ca2+-binding RTX toxin-like protein